MDQGEQAPDPSQSPRVFDGVTEPIWNPTTAITSPEGPGSSRAASVLRASALGLLAAVAVGTAQAAIVVRTGYEYGWSSAIQGAVVGAVVRLARPVLEKVWVWAIAAALTLLSLLLSEYLGDHYGGLESVTQDLGSLLFWGVSLLVACRVAGAGIPAGGRDAPPGWVMAVVSVLAVAVTVVSTGLLREWAVPSGSLDYADLKVGECVQDMNPPGAFVGVRVVDCEDEAHTDEVYATFQLPQQSWPGETTVEDLAWSGCDARFEHYVGVSADDTELDESMFSPEKDTWSDDRTVVCTVSDGVGKQRGSLRDADR